MNANDSSDRWVYLRRWGFHRIITDRLVCKARKSMRFVPSLVCHRYLPWHTAEPMTKGKLMRSGICNTSTANEREATFFFSPLFNIIHFLIQLHFLAFRFQSIVERIEEFFFLKKRFLKMKHLVICICVERWSCEKNFQRSTTGSRVNRRVLKSSRAG